MHLGSAVGCGEVVGCAREASGLTPRPAFCRLHATSRHFTHRLGSISILPITTSTTTPTTTQHYLHTYITVAHHARPGYQHVQKQSFASRRVQHIRARRRDATRVLPYNICRPIVESYVAGHFCSRTASRYPVLHPLTTIGYRYEVSIFASSATSHMLCGHSSTSLNLCLWFCVHFALTGDPRVHYRSFSVW